jgi:hypothetical protein
LVSSSDSRLSVVPVKSAMSEKKTVSFFRLDAISTLSLPIRFSHSTGYDRIAALLIEQVEVSGTRCTVET